MGELLLLWITMVHVETMSGGLWAIDAARRGKATAYDWNATSFFCSSVWSFFTCAVASHSIHHACAHPQAQPPHCKWPKTKPHATQSLCSLRARASDLLLVVCTDTIRSSSERLHALLHLGSLDSLLVDQVEGFGVVCAGLHTYALASCRDCGSTQIRSRAVRRWGRVVAFSSLCSRSLSVAARASHSDLIFLLTSSFSWMRLSFSTKTAERVLICTRVPSIHASRVTNSTQTGTPSPQRATEQTSYVGARAALPKRLQRDALRTESAPLLPTAQPCARPCRAPWFSSLFRCAPPRRPTALRSAAIPTRPPAMRPAHARVDHRMPCVCTPGGPCLVAKVSDRIGRVLPMHHDRRYALQQQRGGLRASVEDFLHPIDLPLVIPLASDLSRPASAWSSLRLADHPRPGA